MADRDDDATPFDEDGWIDRDGPSGRAPAPADGSDDPETGDGAALVDRDEDDAGPEPGPAEAATPDRGWRETPPALPSAEDADDARDPLPGAGEDAFNRVVERELSEHPYLGDSDDDEWGTEDDESSAADSDPEDDAPIAPAGMEPPAAPVETRDGADRRRWPLVSLAVGALALALLALGGIGVIKERSELQAQVRDLQAQLARRPAAGEAQGDRTAVRELQARVQNLAADFASLEGDYALLQGELAAARQQLADREAALETARAEFDAKTAAEASAKAKASAKAASERTAAAAPAAGGEWFVNFGTYGQRSDAASRASRLAVDKGRVVIQDAQSGGRTLYRVRVIELASRDAAESVARDLEARFGLSRLWIGRAN